MTAPIRDRLAEIIKAEAKKYPPGYDLDQGALHLADAVLSAGLLVEVPEIAVAVGESLYVYGTVDATERLEALLQRLAVAESLLYRGGAKT